MATWKSSQAVRGIAVSRWGRPPPPPFVSSSRECPNSETPPITPPDPSYECPDHPLESENGMYVPTSPMEEEEDNGLEVEDWLESQLAANGEMSVVERLQYLLDTGQFADVSVRVGKGNDVAVFKAHRLLLATASQSLYKLVYAVNSNPGPNEITTIRLTDMKPADFAHILKYIYTDSIDCSNINVAFELLRASKKWGLAGMGIKSLNYLEEFLDEFKPSSEDMKTNLFDLLVLSEQSLNDMYEKCIQILVKYCNDVIPCEGFLNLEKPLANKIVNHKDLHFEDQLKLFEAIRDWGLRYINLKNLKMSQLGDVVEDLIKAVDFEKIEDNDFVNTVLTSECLGKAEVIAFFMTHGLEIPRSLDFNNNKQLPFWLWHCATSDSKAREQMESRRGSTINNDSTTSDQVSPPICLKNGAVTAFNKVCRFRKGYRCPQEEIYMPHELRFRVNQNIKLLGVGFGFLFSCTDMGITVHCQGPWETRQWTDIIQTYCRVSGEKQETADVRLMFSEPVKIAKNHSYKVMVKIGRMSAGSSEVDLWGGTGAQYTIPAEDANFFFMKAAVDPNKNVEESDGDTKPGIITELLYQIDTDENEDGEPQPVIRRRRQQPDEEESQQVADETSPWRKRHRPAELTLQIPDTTRARRREASESSSYIATKRSPIEEYKPMSFSTNRWRTKPKEEATESKPQVEEYKPSSFATNRWRVKPQDETHKTTTVDEYKPSSFSTNRWKPKSQEESSVSVVNGTSDANKPSSYSSNRWRTSSRGEETYSNSTLDVTPYSSRKTSAEENTESYSTNRWRTRTREEPQPIKVELRKTIGIDDTKSTSSLPYLRRRESTENKLPELPYLRRRESSETKTPEMPAFLRKRSTATVDENKTATTFGRSRWGSTATSSTSDDTTRSRFLPNSTNTSSYSSSQPTDSYSTRRRDSSASRYGSTRESSLSRALDSTSLSRTRESSLSRARDATSTSRFGPSSISSLGSSYLNRYDTSTKGGTDSGSSSATDKYGSSETSQRKYTGAGSDFPIIRSRFGSPLENGGTDLNPSSRYRSSSIGVKDTGAGSRYGSSSYSGRNDLGSNSRYSTSLSSKGKDTDYSSGLSKYSSSLSSKASDPTFRSTGSRYGSSILTPSTSGYDGSRRKGTDSSTYIYGTNASPSLKYGSTSSRYNSSSTRN